VALPQEIQITKKIQIPVGSDSLKLIFDYYCSFMKNLILILFVFLTTLSAKASHMMGGEITYKYISTLKYEVTVVWYRDCRGISLTSAGVINIKCTSGSFINDTLSIISLEDITTLCNSASSRCNPSNTTATGEGVEKHTYRGIIDFNSSPLNSLASCTGKIIISASVNARSSSITTGPSGNLYIDAELDLVNAPINSSPVIPAQAPAFLCCNVPFYYTFNALDSIDNDSLSYEWAQPRSSATANSSYSGSFSYNAAFTVYDPRPGGGTPLPYATPPIGLFLDAANGDLIFTPVNCTEVTVAVLKITEWRKDTSGTPQIIGKIYRDMQFVVKTCPDNNAPTVSSPYYYTACEGEELCFTISSTDIPFQQPPPAKTPDPDSVTLSWDNRISGATITLISDTARQQQARFCWTPNKNQSRTLPYSFVVTAQDNQCPIRATSKWSFRVRVLDSKTPSSNIAPLSCSQFEITTNEDTAGFAGTPLYRNELYDQNHILITSKNKVNYTSTDSTLGIRGIKKDTITIFNAGIYYLKHLVDGDANSICPQTTWDTIDIRSSPNLELNTPSKNICKHDTLQIASTLSNYSGLLNYQWFGNDSVKVSDTLSSLKVYYPFGNRDTLYVLEVTDTSGCTVKEEIHIYSGDTTYFSLGPDSSYCADSIILAPDVSVASYLWNIGKTDKTIIVDSSGFYILIGKNNFGCIWSDSINLQINKKPDFGVSDTSICQDSIYLETNVFSTYLWSTNDTTSHIWADTTGFYSISITDTNGCAWSKNFQISLSDKNILEPTSSCGAYTLTIPSAKIDSVLWYDGSTSLIRQFDSSGSYIAQLKGEGGCIYTDTLDLTVYALHPLSLVDSSSCDSSISLSVGSYSSIIWNTGDTVSTITADTSGLYICTATDSNGCSYTDTAAIHIYQTHHVSLGNDTLACDAFSFNIPSTSFTSLLWENASTSGSRTITATTQASMKAIDLNGCPSTDTIQINIATSPSVSLPSTIDTCSSVYTFSIGSFDSIRWSTGAVGTSVSVTSSGSYSVVVMDTNGCKDTAYSYITLFPIDTLALGADTSICNTLDINLSSSPFTSFLWNDGTTQSSKSISSAGNYWLKATNQYGCVSSDTIEITTFSIPAITLANDTACGDSITINGPSGYSQYLWSSGDTTQTTVAYQTNSIWLKVLDSNQCETADTAHFTVLHTSLANLGPDVSRCGGSQLLRTNVFGASYLWSTGQTTAIISVTVSGTYYLDITSPNGCTSSDTIEVDIYTQPSSGLADSITVCSDSGYTLICDSFPQILWNTSATTRNLFTTTSGLYSVYIKDSFGCSNTDYIYLTINTLPNVSLGNDTTVCGDSLIVSAIGAITYRWNTGDSTSYLVTNASGEFIVTGTDGNGCQNKDTILVELHNNPTISLGNDTAYCADSIWIAAGNFAQYNWNTGDSTASIAVSATGLYTVQIVDSNGCSSSDSIYLTINVPPIFSLGNDTSLCQDTMVIGVANIYTNYTWSTGDSLNRILVPSTGNYILVVTDSNNCFGSDSIKVTVFTPPSLSLGNDTAFCGDSLLLALAPGNVYTWSTGDSLSFTSINASGYYWVQLTDSNGCSAADTVNITLLSNTNVPFLTKNGLVISSNLSGTHQWFKDATPINGQTDSSITVTSIGSYTAVHLDSNGCISDTSNTITKTAGIDRIISSSLTIYPNPTNGKVTIDATGLGTIQRVEVYDNLGKQVAITQTINGSLINLAWEARSGVLWVVVETEKGVYRQAVVSVR
jgi:hypothetical protein